MIRLRLVVDLGRDDAPTPSNWDGLPWGPYTDSWRQDSHDRAHVDHERLDRFALYDLGDVPQGATLVVRTGGRKYLTVTAISMLREMDQRGVHLEIEADTVAQGTKWFNEIRDVAA